MRFSPRPYQKNAVDSVLSRYANGSSRLLLHLPTGAGKTVIAAIIVEKMLQLPQAGKVLFVAHREEILDQTMQKLKQHLPKVNIQIEQGKRYSDSKAQITIASVQSLIKRKERFNPSDFTLIICDECHRALAPSWTEVISYFFENIGNNSLLLGMTATPRRSDGRSALSVFNVIAYEISRLELQDLGYIVPMHYYTIQTDLHLDRVKMSGGDFQVGSLTKIMNTPEKRALALNAWLEKGKDKKTVVFCAGVAHARQLAYDFKQIGIRAQTIDAKTSGRREILKKFKNKELDVLTNYGVLTEGYDDPGIECILMARPTTSPLVYTQCVGRGLRISKGKTSCTVIDIIDRSTHQLQYGAAEMCGLPKKWKSRGRDPYREAHSISGIKLSDPEAFLKVRSAQSLEEIQSILMSLPPDSVLAGLDGVPVLHYEPLSEKLTFEKAIKEIRKVIDQSAVQVNRISRQENGILISLVDPEVNNEQFLHLKWHLERATGWTVEYKLSTQRRNPRAFLKSMLNENQKIKYFYYDAENKKVVSWINNLPSDRIMYITKKFHEKTDMTLELRGQMSLF
ncbi:DEAD/DEAH box helicase [bacterium]|nr:DEAD/DEAH box helicase [bacterium]